MRHRSTQKHTAAHSTQHQIANSSIQQHTAAHNSTQQHTAAQQTAAQHTAAHSILQHTTHQRQREIAREDVFGGMLASETLAGNNIWKD